MAAGVSSSSRPAYLHHHLPLTTNNISGSSSAATSNTNSSNSSTFNPTSAAISSPTTNTTTTTTTTTLSLPLPDFDHSRRSLSPNSSSGSSSNFSTPATSPLPHSPLEPVAESEFSSPPSPASALSTSFSRQRQQQPQPLQQSGVNSARGDSRSQKPGGFFAFAASAIDRTQSAIATISDPNVRHKRSLSRLSISADLAGFSRGVELSPDKPSRYRPASIVSSSSSANLLSPLPTDSKFPSSQTSLAQEIPYSQPYSQTDPSHPPPILLPRVDNKMHQTSSRLLRMTDDDRPFTKVSRRTTI